MSDLVRTARLTGVFYLGLGITAMLGFLIVRPQLFIAGDPAATLGNLVGHETLARAGVALELGVVVTQALAAVWFYRLFRIADPLAAGSIGAFGLVNAVAIMGSAAMLATAVEVAGEPIGDAATIVQALYLVSGNLWGVGNLFFGLWLIPMGMCVIRSRWMPRPLGWVLVIGGLCYLASGFLLYLAPDAQIVADLLVVPATVGELWMIGYLLSVGVRRKTPSRVLPHRQGG
ncbi:DUF4386 domain-containing protein [Solwaraspora sp. WMMD937]|uniref:DUF4386 domain-containing protein n=1 Tax=Solwaraspora sp. WMMD937 TaxID=3016090 RepID=UPI00249BD381|nr:DUF4386 domain-containing protein [Solwaraspora sp. WMMD937]WFE20906.1 DUF4386 domain-containing protein [Solwaraspora sp. WMMD937]